MNVEAKNSVITGIDKIVNDVSGKTVKVVRVYNVAGNELRDMQPGVNIIVTEYTDGTTSTTKVLR